MPTPSLSLYDSLLHPNLYITWLYYDIIEDSHVLYGFIWLDMRNH